MGILKGHLERGPLVFSAITGGTRGACRLRGTRADLLEIIDDRAANKATIITSQLPIEHWHPWVGDAIIADAILDRVMQKNHSFNLTASLFVRNPNQAKRRSIQTHRDRHPYNLDLQYSTLRHRSRSAGISGHDRRNTQRILRKIENRVVLSP